MSAPSQIVPALAFTGAVLLTACEMPHTSLFDPATPVSIVIHPPDTLHSSNQTFRLSVTTTPQHNNPRVQWTFRVGNQLVDWIIPTPTPGEFRIGASGPLTVVRVFALVGPHAAETTLVFRQKLARTRGDCEVFCIGYLGRETEIRARLLDSMGSAFTGTLPPNFASGLISRDSSKAYVRRFERNGATLRLWLTTGTRGSTYFVFEGPQRDSALVFVDHYPDAIRMTCPSTMRVGETASLTAQLMARGEALINQPPWEWSADIHSLRLLEPGRVVALARGSVQVRAREFLTHSEGMCSINIV